MSYSKEECVRAMQRIDAANMIGEPGRAIRAYIADLEEQNAMLKGGSDLLAQERDEWKAKYTALIAQIELGCFDTNIARTVVMSN